jgi:LysM repeat protein
VNVTSFKRRFLLLIVVLLLTLAACERPVPREITPEAAEPVPTTDVIIIPTIPPESGDATAPANGTDQSGTPASEGTTGDTAATPEGAATEEAAGTGDTSTEQETVDAGGQVTHVVQAGDTLGSLAQFYHVTIEDIAAANNLTNLDVLEIGQTLIIKAGAAVEASPVPDTTTPTDGGGGEQTYVVQAGDNLFRIGLRFGFTAEELAAYNNIPDISRIDVGQIIRIPPK